MKTRQPDPTPEDIAERFAQIQAGWTADEKQRRLRADLRPVVRCGDNNVADVTSDSLAVYQAACEGSRP